MVKTKNDPAQYQKRAVSAPKAQRLAAINEASLFFTAPVIKGCYLDFRAVVISPPKRTGDN